MSLFPSILYHCRFLYLCVMCTLNVFLPDGAFPSLPRAVFLHQLIYFLPGMRVCENSINKK